MVVVPCEDDARPAALEEVLIIPSGTWWPSSAGAVRRSRGRHHELGVYRDRCANFRP